MSKIARVVLDSPLPSLDKIFDYAIPDELESRISIGHKVSVPFGRSKKLSDAFVIEIAESTEFNGKLSSIADLQSPVVTLPANMYRLFRSIADRQASTLGDVLTSAIVTRTVRVEKQFIERAPLLQERSTPTVHEITAELAQPTSLSNEFSAQPLADWIIRLLRQARHTVENGNSVILLVPDFRDQGLLRDAIAQSVLSEHYIDFTSDQKGSARYASFLRCLEEGTHIVVGSRAALYAPLQNLGLIVCFDDGDKNFQDQQSPYAHARDIALLRQLEDACSLKFVAHARSCELQRLIDIGYVTEVSSPFVLPKVAFDETTARVSTLAWQTIRESAETGVVLVQVGSKGVARTAYCQNCSTRAMCSRCYGPIWIDSTSTPRCRWCNAQNLAFACPDCKSTNLRQGSGGTTRTLAEFGAAFPGLSLLETTGDKPMTSVDGKRKIVISTPGAEPETPGGYSAVVILDGRQALNRDSLRASEDAVREWSNAIAKMRVDGRSVVVGIPAELGQSLSLWQHQSIARQELDNRRDLNFPPHLRLGSVEGPIDAINEIVASVNIDNVQVLGPISVLSKSGEDRQRLILKYPYSATAGLVAALRSAQLNLTAGMTKTSATGRISRAIRIRMDDPEVI